MLDTGLYFSVFAPLLAKNLSDMVGYIIVAWLCLYNKIEHSNTYSNCESGLFAHC